MSNMANLLNALAARPTATHQPADTFIDRLLLALAGRRPPTGSEHAATLTRQPVAPPYKLGPVAPPISLVLDVSSTRFMAMARPMIRVIASIAAVVTGILGTALLFVIAIQLMSLSAAMPPPSRAQTPWPTPSGHVKVGDQGGLDTMTWIVIIVGGLLVALGVGAIVLLLVRRNSEDEEDEPIRDRR